MSKNKQPTNPRVLKDWKAQLQEAKETLPGGEGKKTKQYRTESRNNKPRRKREPERIHQEIPQDGSVEFYLSFLYRFLAGYKYNAGIYINNFLRGRSFDEYIDAIFDTFTMDFYGKIIPTDFGDLEYSFELVSRMRTLSKDKIAYYPFDYVLAKEIIALDALWRVLPQMSYPTTVYRGCNGIAKNGLNGIVSTTTDIRIARQFSRGTVLCIHLPKGMPFLDINSIRPDKEKGRDLENEIIIPPCEYRVLSKKTVEKRNEPNNHHNETLLIDVQVIKPLDFLEEVLKVLENPPEEYKQHYVSKMPEMHEVAISFIKKAMEIKASN